MTASLAGWIAIAAAAVSVLGIAVALALHVRLRRVRAAQLTLLGSGGGDLVDFAVSLQGRIDGVHRALDEVRATLGRLERRVDSTVSRLAVVRYDAYGWSGPWRARRGYDSLVQMSSGIAHPGHDGKPTPLPAQALDHGTGYLIAAATCRALAEGCALSRLSLARTARVLVDLGLGGDAQAPGFGDARDVLQDSATEWGPARQVPCPGRIEGYDAGWRIPSGPLGRHKLGTDH